MLNNGTANALQAVLVPTDTVPDTPVVCGYDFTHGRDLDGLMAAMMTSGFQATTLGQAVEEVNRMVGCMGCSHAVMHSLLSLDYKSLIDTRPLERTVNTLLLLTSICRCMRRCLRNRPQTSEPALPVR